MRIALVGLGDAGFTMHLPALAGMDGAEVVGACDTDEGRRLRAARAFRIPVFADFDEMLRAGRPEVIVVGTPPDAHAECCRRGLAAGAHVICEKPFVSSVEEADILVDEAGRARRGLAVNHQFRDMPIFRSVLAETARTGDLSFVDVWQLVNLPPGTEAGWRGRMRDRTLYEAGVHLVDYVMALFGERPLSVQASASAAGLAGGADAVTIATLEFSRGRLALVAQNRACKGERHYFEVRADTASASFRASFGGRARLSAGLFHGSTPHLRFERGASGLAWKETGSRRTVLARNPKDPMVLATRSLFARTLAAFAEGRRPPVSGEDARDGLAVIAACYDSVESGCRVRLDGNLSSRLRSRRFS